MYLFYVTEPVELEVESAMGSGTRPDLRQRPVAGSASAPRRGKGVRLEPPAAGTLTAENLYFGFSRRFLADLAALRGNEEERSVVRVVPQERVLSHPQFPARLGYHGRGSGRATLEAQLAAAPLPTRALVAVVNLFGLAYGDSVVLLSALHEFRRRLEAHAGEVLIELLQHPDNTATEPLYLRSGVVDAVRHLPAPLTLLTGYDAWVDLTTPYSSRGLPWIDEMLELFAIDPGSVPPERKRNHLTVSPAVAAELNARVAVPRRPMVLFHHRASTPERSIPEHHASRLLGALLERCDWTIASALPVSFSHPRFVDWSGVSASFEHLVYLVSRADAVLCVDTCVYHVADALGVPGVALFTSVPPGVRVEYYPGVHGIQLGGEANGVLGKPLTTVPEDLARAEALWTTLDLDDVVTRIDRLLRRAN
jgi:hypothetical protein